MSAGHSRATHLGDFQVTPRLLLIAGLAIPVGGAAAGAAYALLKLIGFITNLVFYQRLSTEMVAPGATHHPWWLVLSAPVVGGLIIGVMARYGSEKIRGHGMPEAIEAILTGGSRVQPRVALLKPASAAISIGSGGPFGAEGPIIMTGGAVGSILAQLLKLSADERKTLLVAGSAAGMAATFNAPLAAILLAVELLLFEWRPRSFVPVVAAVVAGTICRWAMLGNGPVFAVATDGRTPGGLSDGLALIPGITGGLLAIAATAMVYFAEDSFARLPVHWMWWPAIGGLIIGIGGLFEPRALGVGYDVIDQLLTGHATLSLIVGILVVKTLIWSLSLGSGTSGGVLAPVFMIGAALGAAEGGLLPHVTAGFWAMCGLAAVVGGVMRSPLTGIVFTCELTHAWNDVLPLAVASVSACGEWGGTDMLKIGLIA
jgi:H+/Cl- antiporter ClcA